MQAGETFTIWARLRGGEYNFDCTCMYVSAQVLRFRLTHKTMEMEVQKMLLTKSRFKWKLTHCNFTFTKEHAGQNLNTLFNYLDTVLKNPPSLHDYLNSKKSW